MTRPTIMLFLAATAAAITPGLVRAQDSEPPVKILPDWSYQPFYDRAASVKNDEFDYDRFRTRQESAGSPQ